MKKYKRKPKKTIYNKVIKVKQFINKNTDKTLEQMLLEFAELHVKAALKEACSNHRLHDSNGYGFKVLDTDSILNAYPFHLVK